MTANFLDYVLNYYYLWGSIVLMMVGLYGVITRNNLIKKIMALAIFQVSALLLYVSSGYKDGGALPIFVKGINSYVNPLPHVLMLTAIVVGVAVMAVGLALVVRIKEEYGVIEEDKIIALDKFEEMEIRKSEKEIVGEL